MKISRLLQYCKYYLQFFPFKLNFILLVLISFITYRFLNQTKIETSSYYGIAFLMAKIVFIFCISIISVSLLSCIIAWIYFVTSKQSNKIELNLELIDTDEKLLNLRTNLPFAIKPFLGFVKMRLLFDKHAMTEKLILAGRIKKQFIPFGSGLSGLNKLYLPDIKAYYFHRSILYFEDMLQLFSFATSVPVNQHILNTPKSLLHKTNELPPKKTEEEIIRIDQLRKVEGEYLNYKKFEDSDDVRRIVWKIFAKNKELVVRVPEIMDPFASHLYFYATFFHSMHAQLNANYHLAMLNHYKNCVWTLYDALSKKEFEVKYISDQEIHAVEANLNPVQVSLALSQWQTDTPVATYFKPKSGSVLCVHSYTNLTELEQVLSNCDSNTTIFFIQLSKTFKSYYLLSWISRLFLKPPKDELQRMKSRWAIHPLKFSTLRLEKQMNTMLKKYDLNVEVI